IDRMELNLINTENGANWEALIPESDDEANDAAEETSTEMDIPVSIPLVSITNSRVRYQDLTDGTDIAIEQLELEARDVSLTKDLPLLISLRYPDQDDTRIDLKLDTKVNTDINANQYRLSPLVLDVNLAGLTTNPVAVTLNASVLADLEKDQLEVSNLAIKALGTETSGAITVHHM